MLNKICAIYPSRSRPAQFVSSYRHLLDHAGHQENVDVILRIDNDDPLIHLYQSIPLRKNDRIIIDLPPGSDQHAGFLNNEIYKTVKDDYDIYLPMADDVLCITKDWDVIFINTFDTIPRNIGLINDRGVFAITSGWTNVVGYLFPDKMCGAEDIYMHYLGLEVNKYTKSELHYQLKEKMFDHLHPKLNARSFDEVDALGSKKRKGWRKRYQHDLFKNSLEKLKKAINANMEWSI